MNLGARCAFFGLTRRALWCIFRGMNENLLDTTLSLFRASKASVPEISRATGLKVRWLQRLRAGDFDDPGVRKIERLHAFLVAAESASEVDAA